jgi:RHS repeat-associated protein
LSGTYYQILYAPTGEKLALFEGQTLHVGFVALPGGATAFYQSWGLNFYRHPDWLGSSRLDTSTTSVVQQDTAYAPFGEPYATKSGGNGDYNFTGQNKDTLWLQYDFMFRQYSPVQSRWSSPDPAGLVAADVTNPQSWNRYAYLSNEPLTGVDPSGMFRCGLCYDGDDDGGGDPPPPPDPCFFDSEFCGGGSPPPILPPGGGIKAPLNPKDQRRYDKQKAKALKDLMNPDCIAFCTSHGIDPVALAQTIQNQQAFNGSQSTITQADAQAYISKQNDTVAQGFKGTSKQTVDAGASLNGTDLYFHQGGFLSSIFGNPFINEATIEHEGLHNYCGMECGGAFDADLQRMLGLPVNTSDTTNITQALKDHHCAH